MQCNINSAEYRDKVLGCWWGKNLGGTLGAPVEGKQAMNDITFFPKENLGRPAPNDDLDLQLLWLAALERYGIQGITAQRMAEMWMGHVIGPWGEYVNCKLNIANGLYPPLSGSCNNDKWRNSNGAWIRSEIWACICPGAPDEAIQYAAIDSSVDHSGEGIYAELFTAAAEAAAFVLPDIRMLIGIGLSKIPADCLTARLINLVCKSYNEGKSWQETRQAVLEANTLGWFQAPANLAFAVIGLLYGEGDFAKTVARAVNCGDDTDCTAGFAGALLGIILGKSHLPQDWCQYIGNSIITCANNNFEMYDTPVPSTVDELTDRVAILGQISSLTNAGTVAMISAAPTAIPEDIAQSCLDTRAAERIHQRSPYALEFNAPFADFTVDYVDGIQVEPGKPKEIILKAFQLRGVYDDIAFRWIMPEGWQVTPEESHEIILYSTDALQRHTIIPGAFHSAIEFVELDVSLASRRNSMRFRIPFQLKGAINYEAIMMPEKLAHDWNRWNNRSKLPHFGNNL